MEGTALLLQHDRNGSRVDDEPKLAAPQRESWLWLPIENDGNRHRDLNWSVDEEALTIGRNHVLAIRRALWIAAEAHDEERTGCAHLDTVALRVEPNRYGHQPIVGRQVEELFAITSPPNLHAAGGRDPHLVTRTGKRLHENLLPRAGFLGLIRDPFTVWRKLATRRLDV